VIRYGLGVGYFPVTPPYVPGNGVAGRVISTGMGVDPAWVGRPVAAHTGESGGSGGYAEQVAVLAEDVIAVPDGLGLPEAAALLHDGVTALGLLERVGVKPGEWVLVTAAAGGMGVLLVQLARAAGGRVIGAARGARKLRLVRDVGAEAVVDYSEAGWAGRVRELTGDGGWTWCSTAPAAASAAPRSRSRPPAAGFPRTGCPMAGSPESAPATLIAAG
jgi:NADPH:quinone reductase